MKNLTQSLATLLLAALCAAILLMPTPAHAQPVDAAQRIRTMSARCVPLMVNGTCRAFNDGAKAVPPSDPLARITYPGGEWITAQQLYDFQQNPDMCKAIERECKAAWFGPGCIVARKHFKQY